MVDFSNSNLDRVSDMSEMFNYAFGYGERINNVKIDFRNVDMSSVENMQKMFYDF
jgi:hypothetical protein